MAVPSPAGVNADAPWLILVADSSTQVYASVDEGLARHTVLGRPIRCVHALSADDAVEQAVASDANRLAVVLVAVGLDEGDGAFKVLESLREQLGSSVQIVLYAAEPGEMPQMASGSHYDVSAYLSKTEVSRDRIRTLADVFIRNFQRFRAVRVFGDSLSSFVTLFENAKSVDAVDMLAYRVLEHYSLIWQFSYLFIEDIGNPAAQAPEEPWKRSALKQLRGLRLGRYPSATLQKLHPEGEGQIWGCLIKPVGRRFLGGFALRQPGAPDQGLLRELRLVLRSWALTRESVELQLIAARHRRLREEMHRERRESIAKMVAGVAHEVNTPLGVAASATATVQEIMTGERFRERIDHPSLQSELEDIQEGLALIQRNLERADRLIHNFRKLSVGHLVDKREELDLSATVEEIVYMWSPEARRGNIEVHVTSALHPEASMWWGYMGFLSQVLLNLLENAKTHALDEVGGSVNIAVSSDLVDDRALFMIEVSDDGKGISPDDLPYIFETFFTTGRGKGGTGLGLALVQNIVETVFRGAIECESTPGHGTSFLLSFSHCTDSTGLDVNRDGDEVDDQQRVSAVERFIELQHKLASGESLSGEEQAELHDLTHVVDRYMAERAGGHERRQATRIPLAKSVKVWIGDSPGAVEMEVRDISATGAGHVHTEPLEPGTRLTTKYWESPDVIVEGKVVSCREVWLLDSQRQVWEIGVRLELSEEKVMRNFKLILARLLIS